MVSGSPVLGSFVLKDSALASLAISGWMCIAKNSLTLALFSAPKDFSIASTLMYTLPTSQERGTPLKVAVACSKCSQLGRELVPA